MEQRNNFVFKALHIIAWIIFIGLSIEAAALLVNFIFSICKPEVVHNLYEKVDLSQMYRLNKWIFFSMYGFILFISIMKACLFYVVVMLLHKLNLSKPFDTYVANQIKKMSSYTLSIGLISYIAREIAKGLPHYGFEIETLNRFWADSQAWILMTAVIYVISTIFSRGVELQNENDLTI